MLNDAEERMNDKLKVTAQDVAAEREVMKKDGAVPLPTAKPAPNANDSRRMDGRKPGRKAPPTPPPVPVHAPPTDLLGHIEAVRQLGAERVRKIVGLFE
jgi:hypothetical protein